MRLLNDFFPAITSEYGRFRHSGLKMQVSFRYIPVILVHGLIIRVKDAGTSDSGKH
jgi:hypothetical protein